MPLAVIWKTITSPFAAVLRATGMLKNPVMPDVDLSHRVVIVTGANTGAVHPLNTTVLLYSGTVGTQYSSKAHL